MSVGQHFRSLTDDMQADIIAWTDRELSGNRIHALLIKKYGERAPTSRQTVYNFLNWLALQERPELDEWERPWTLAAMADPKCDITWADAALVLRVWRKIREALPDPHGFPIRMLRGDMLSVAEARWIAGLGRLAPGADPLHLYVVAVMYGNTERLGRIRGKPWGTAMLDETIDLETAESFADTLAWARTGMFTDRDVAVVQHGDGGES